jgi:hypothetical protein
MKHILKTDRDGNQLLVLWYHKNWIVLVSRKGENLIFFQLGVGVLSVTTCLPKGRVCFFDGKLGW